jgi:hypothetical protein
MRQAVSRNAGQPVSRSRLSLGTARRLLRASGLALVAGTALVYVAFLVLAPVYAVAHLALDLPTLAALALVATFGAWLAWAASA